MKIIHLFYFIYIVNFFLLSIFIFLRETPKDRHVGHPWSIKSKTSKEILLKNKAAAIASNSASYVILLKSFEFD